MIKRALNVVAIRPVQGGGFLALEWSGAGSSPITGDPTHAALLAVLPLAEQRLATMPKDAPGYEAAAQAVSLALVVVSPHCRYRDEEIARLLAAHRDALARDAARLHSHNPRNRRTAGC